MQELLGTAKVIYDEVVDEIDEELKKAFSDILREDVVSSMISDIIDESKNDIVGMIEKGYSDTMSVAVKMILGEKISRLILNNMQKHLQSLNSTVIEKSFNVINKMRNEVIGEIFEETA